MSAGDWTQNPFAAADSDPFNDPSVKAASGGKAAEYNPFDHTAPPPAAAPAAYAPPAPVAAAAAAAPARDPIAQGAASFGKKSPPPAAAPPAAAAAAADDNDTPAWAKPNKGKQQAAPAPAPAAAAAPAKTKEAHSAEEVQRRKEYEQREQAVKETFPKKDPNNRPPNFPPFPKKCPTPFKPCYHHDFKGEMPSFGYKLALESYYLWMFTGLAYFWNFVASLAALGTNVSGTSQSAGISCAFMIIGFPCAYCCWFQHLYTAFRTDSSLRYGMWFFVTTMQMIFAAFLAVGFPSTGAGGYWVAIAAVTDNKVIGIILFVSAILWSINIAWSMWLIKRVLSIYRATGGSTDKAKGELQAVGAKAAYGAATSDAGQAAIRGAAASWANDPESHA